MEYVCKSVFINAKINVIRLKVKVPSIAWYTKAVASGLICIDSI